MTKYNYQLRKLSDCKEGDRISADPAYTTASVVAFIIAHNTNALNIEEHCHFAAPEDYRFAEKTAPVILAVPV